MCWIIIEKREASLLSKHLSDFHDSYRAGEGGRLETVNVGAREYLSARQQQACRLGLSSQEE